MQLTWKPLKLKTERHRESCVFICSDLIGMESQADTRQKVMMMVTDRGETHTGPSFLLLLVSLQYQSFFLNRKPELSRRKMFKREREKLDSDLLRCYDSPWVSGVPSFFDFGEGDY